MCAKYKNTRRSYNLQCQSRATKDRMHIESGGVIQGYVGYRSRFYWRVAFDYNTSATNHRKKQGPSKGGGAVIFEGLQSVYILTP